VVVVKAKAQQAAALRRLAFTDGRPALAALSRSPPPPGRAPPRRWPACYT
jgi:hypothetical protein